MTLDEQRLIIDHLWWRLSPSDLFLLFLFSTVTLSLIGTRFRVYFSLLLGAEDLIPRFAFYHTVFRCHS